MERRAVYALILASLAFGFVLGWVVAGGRGRLKGEPTPGEVSQQMAPGMRSSSPQATPQLPPDHPPVDNFPSSEEIQTSIADFQERLKNNPDDFKAWHELGKLYAFSNNAEKATEAYEKAVKLAPTDTQIKIELGFIYINSGRMEDADHIADNVLQQNPNQTDALFLKGTTLAMLQKDYKGAIQHYEKILKLDPNYPMAGFIQQSIQQMQTKLKSSSPLS